MLGKGLTIGSEAKEHVLTSVAEPVGRESAALRIRRSPDSSYISRQNEAVAISSKRRIDKPNDNVYLVIIGPMRSNRR